MIEHLIITLAAGGQSITGADVIDDNGKWVRCETVTDIKATAYAQIFVVCSGVDVSCFLQGLPDLPMGKLHKILPSVMADQLGQGFENQHFAVWETETAQKLVAVCSHEFMQTALATLKSAGVSAGVFVPDYCLVPVAAETQAVIADAGLVSVRLPDHTGFTIEAESFEIILPETDARSLSTEEKQALYGHILAIEENLLQGAYANSSGVWDYLLLFRRAAVLLILLSFVWLAASYNEITKKEEQVDRLYAEADALFRKSFPQIKRVVNVEIQARQEIAKLQAGGAPKFLQLSSALFSAVEQSEATLLEAVRFDADRNEMVVTLSFPSFAEGEQIKELLAGNNVRVGEGSSRQQNDRIFTDLTLGSAL